jgi:hypothetical protein
MNMDIRCTSTGKIFYQIDTQIAALLIEALPTVFERVEKPAPAEKQAGALEFAIDHALTTGEACLKFHCPQCGQGGVVLNGYPNGKPGQNASKFAEEAARSFYFWHCGKKEVLPQSLIDAFKGAFE